jgi:hypothetical protein
MKPLQSEQKTEMSTNSSLTVASPSPLAKTVLEGCSQELRGLLDVNQGFLYAVDQIARAQHLHDEAKRALEKLEGINRPASSGEIVSELAPLIALYGVQDKGEDEWAAFWSIYIEDLARYPRWVVAEASRSYRRQKDSNWFPRPGPLRALCEEAFRISCAAQSRLSCALKATGKASA